MSDTPRPALTIVVTIDGQRDRAERCLRSLVAQENIDDLDILVQDVGHDRHPPLSQYAHPRVRVVPLPRGLSYGEALARGAAAAEAPFVAYIEEHVTALPGWATALLAAHAAQRTGGPWSAVGSEMHFDNPGRGASDLIDLLAVGPWMAPAIAGETSAARWQNTSYRRDVLLSYGDRLPRFLDAEAVFFLRLVADGHRIGIEPAARLRHASEHSFLLFLRGSITSNRLFAARRVELMGLSPARRLLSAGAALVNTFRAPGYILRGLRRAPELVPKYRLARRRLPQLFLYAAAFSAAAGLGYLVGAGRSGVRFLDYELNAARDISGYERSPFE